MGRFCPGFAGVACRFSSAADGHAARLCCGHRLCIFCDRDRLRTLLASEQGLSVLTVRLRVPWRQDKEVQHQHCLILKRENYGVLFLVLSLFVRPLRNCVGFLPMTRPWVP